MPKKRKAFVHIGLDDGSGDFIDDALEVHGHALAELGVRRPARSREEMFRAALEMLRTHKEWGYRRSEVEGAWTGIVRRALKGHDTLVFSQPLLAAARPEQVALFVDALAGFEVHVVVTVRAPHAWVVPGEPAHDLGSVLDRWSAAVRKPERLHVVVADDTADTWTSFGRIVGFGTASLGLGSVPTKGAGRTRLMAEATRGTVLQALGTSWAEQLAATAHHVVGDPARLVPATAAETPTESLAVEAERALVLALAELERVSRRNESLELRLEELTKKQRKLKRRLSAVA